MTAALRLPFRQGTPEWLDARRGFVSSTDIPVLLGLSPWKVESQLADEKAGLVEPSPPSAAMRLGLAMEPFVADEYTALTSRRVRRVRNLLRHPELEWAVASLDREVVGERRLVEIKTTGGRRWDDGVPQDAESQVRWAMGVSGIPRADVVLWSFAAKEPLRVFDLEHDAATFEGLVEIAQDFRVRLAAGGPFAESSESLKRRYPRDNGTELVADGEVSEAVKALVAVRTRRKALEGQEEVLETAIKSRMAEASVLVGQGFHVIWRRTKDVATPDWKSIADGLLRQLPETERAALVGIGTTVRPGFRPFRVVLDKETDE